MGTITRMLRDLDPQFKACMYTTDEFIDLGEAYGIQFKDPTRLVFNAIYHFGSIYDHAMDLAYMADPSVKLDTSGFHEIGKLAGNIFTQTFYNFKDYDYPEVKIVYPAED